MSDTEFSIPIGPQHPALKEPASFLFKVDGEVVVDVEPRVGYNHRGIEKAMEAAHTSRTSTLRRGSAVYAATPTRHSSQ